MALQEYSTVQLTRAYGVTLSALRHYEGMGLISPHRNGANRRRYAPAERDRIELILQLRAAGLSLRKIRKVVQAGRDRGPADQIAVACDCLNERIFDLECALKERPDQLNAAREVLRSLQARMAA